LQNVAKAGVQIERRSREGGSKKKKSHNVKTNRRKRGTGVAGEG